MTHEEEIQALQNFATSLGLTVRRYFEQDKRKRGWKYYLVDNGCGISPSLNYEGLNNFMLGMWNERARSEKQIQQLKQELKTNAK